MRPIGLFFLSLFLWTSCQQGEQPDTHRIVTVDPGHFHASLLQKSMLAGVDSICYVYAPSQEEAAAHLALLEGYNSREENPTNWAPEVYTGSDFFQQMLSDRPGDIVVLAGNNRLKTNYIFDAVDAGLSVLADKPMAINAEGFRQLEQAFAQAEDKGVLLYDIMTERYNVFSILQKAMIHEPLIFGQLEKGSPSDPAVIKTSLHHFYKEVSGSPLRRPAWYYDVEQEGEGLVDVTTHAIDLVQWQIFPETVFDYEKDVEMLRAERWPTYVSLSEFFQSTGETEVPAYLGKDQQGDTLKVFANGNMVFNLKGVHAKISVAWNFQAAAGSGDTHISQIKGSRSTISIRQGQAEGFKPTLYIEPTHEERFTDAELDDIQKGVLRLESKYKGITLEKSGNGFKLGVPEALIQDHEAHFSQVANRFLEYLDAGEMPAWEKSYMLTKYFITSEAAKMAGTLPGPPVH
ncbi:MAG TPA: Gfo/Idh/MocA family oxidoreductase [Candidatus Sphingobacterium stercorigallinarum]|nr:Gfo/Idh/MocA family oxidoreductase [Candidatus Sphingobacterium stercorigallinarum]